MIQLGNELHYLAAYSCHLGTSISERILERSRNIRLKYTKPYRTVNDDLINVSSGYGHWSKKALSR